MKKYIIIFILLITFLFTSFYIQQKRAEAVVPLVVYVAVSVLINFAVGTYIYLKSQDSSGSETHKISSINSETGEMQLEFIENVETVTEDLGGISVPLYDIPLNSMPLCGPTVFVGYDPLDPIEKEERRQLAIQLYCHDGLYNPNNPSNYGVYCTIEHSPTFPTLYQWRVNVHTTYCINGGMSDGEVPKQFGYDPLGGGLGGVYTGNVEGIDVDMYEFAEDLPIIPDCFDGIQNQDEEGIDCGGICLTNFGFDCTAWEKCFNGIQDQDETGIDCGGYCLTALGISCDQGTGTETCFDRIMNQDETGIDYGGVCGTGDTVSTPSVTFIDENGDGIDDISGLANDGTIPSPMPSVPDQGTYDPSLPGDISEVGETGWSDLILGYLSINPLVLLATGNDIILADSSCTLTANVFDNDFTIDFCSVQGMIDLIGTFVLGLMAIRSVFIALGI